MAYYGRDILKDIIRHQKYRVKQYLSFTQRLCPGCMGKLHGQGDAHHLFVRRGPDTVELYDPINLVLVHNECHTDEAPLLGYTATIMKLNAHGPDAIEAWVESLPFKQTPDLPEFYWQAKEDWLNGKHHRDY